jgi:hypothetical protein
MDHRFAVGKRKDVMSTFEEEKKGSGLEIGGLFGYLSGLVVLHPLLCLLSTTIVAWGTGEQY